VIGFGARAMGDAQPKYLNSAQGPLFDKSREMYGLHLARDAAVKAGRLIVVEGYTDVMHCHQAGLHEVAAGLGTALAAENVKQLSRFGVPVLLVYDGDEAGRRAAERASEILLELGVHGAVALLPPGCDPADLLVERGRDAVEEVLDRAQDRFEYRLDRAVERHGLRTLDGREKIVSDLLVPIARIADAVSRDSALRLLAERTSVPESTIRNEVRVRPAAGRAARGEAADPPAPAELGWVDAERIFLEAVLLDERIWDRVEQLHPPARFRDPALREVAQAVGNLRTHGESVNREALLGALAESELGLRGLQSLDPSEETLARAEKDLNGIRKERLLRSALEKNDLAAVVAARRASESGSSPAGGSVNGES
jgi:DNA primase